MITNMIMIFIIDFNFSQKLKPLLPHVKSIVGKLSTQLSNRNTTWNSSPSIKIPQSLKAQLKSPQQQKHQTERSH